MPIINYKPTSAARRNMSVTDYTGLSKNGPEKSLLAPLDKKAGRNSYGRITVRHRGGGNRKKYRIIDFKRQKHDMEATVLSIEYDPNRSAFIALVQYEDGEKKYIIAPNGLKAGDKVVSGAAADIKPGNALPLKNIPVGTFIHNVELYPGKGAQLARAAGIMAQLMAKENGMALLRLPSGELRNVPENCMASIGQVSNIDHENVKIGKAGRKRHMGWRPTAVSYTHLDVYKRQGTGRARQGSTRAPQWTHGGIVFAPKPRSYRYTLNKKVRRLAMKSALSSKLQDNELIVIDQIASEEYKTKAIAAMLKAVGSERKALIVLDTVDEKVIASARNIPGVKTAQVNTLNVYDILNADKFIVVKDAVAKIEEVYA